MLIVWFVISALLLPILSAPFLLPEDWITEASGLCRSRDHGDERCVLCGMTQAFWAISHGNFQQALIHNQGSLMLYGVFLMNEMIALIYLLRIINNHFYFIKSQHISTS